jgi:hypothetical protein
MTARLFNDAASNKYNIQHRIIVRMDKVEVGRIRKKGAVDYCKALLWRSFGGHFEDQSC